MKACYVFLNQRYYVTDLWWWHCSSLVVVWGGLEVFSCQFQTRKLSETVDGLCLIFQQYFPIFSAQMQMKPTSTGLQQNLSEFAKSLFWAVLFSCKNGWEKEGGEKEKLI